MKRCSLLLVLALLSAGALHAQQDVRAAASIPPKADPPIARPAPAAAADTPQAPAPVTAAPKPGRLRPFTPTEKIRADVAVAFPADI